MKEPQIIRATATMGVPAVRVADTILIDSGYDFSDLYCAVARLHDSLTPQALMGLLESALHADTAA